MNTIVLFMNTSGVKHTNTQYTKYVLRENKSFKNFQFFIYLKGKPGLVGPLLSVPPTDAMFISRITSLPIPNI